MSSLNITDSILENVNKFTFGTTDYVVFVVMLCISAGIGAYFGFFDKSADTTEEYLMGGKRMKTIPIAISLVASQLSGISIMTIPAEMYSFGINWAFNVLCMIIIIPILCWVVTPVFYNNNISNCYEYLEMRFNRNTRQLLTIAFIGTLFLMLPIFIFIPALAFSQVTGINIHLINTIVCSICIFYTMFGGIKAVVWTDVVQASIMVISVITVGIMGASKVGGFGEVIRIATEGKRLDVNFTLDFRTRSSIWNCFIGGSILWTAYVGFNQSCVQRIVSLPSLNHAKKALIYFGFGFLIIMFFNCFTGLVAYAVYHDCDPLQTGHVEKMDKLMPYFVQDIAGDYKGMPGVFISCVFSAALSTMSACLNSMSGVVYFDYIKPHIRHTESRANLIMKAFVLFAGIYSIFAGVIVEKFTSILQLTYSVGGVTLGSIFGVFMMGMLVPRAHGRAAFWAVVTSMSVMLIIVVGGQGRVLYKPLETSVEGCEDFNKTSSVAFSTSSSLLQISKDNLLSDFDVFEVSFNWYSFIGAVIVFVVGIPLSYIFPPEKGSKFDPKLLSPIVRSFGKYELTHVEEELSDVPIKK